MEDTLQPDTRKDLNEGKISFEGETKLLPQGTVLKVKHGGTEICFKENGENIARIAIPETQTI